MTFEPSIYQQAVFTFIAEGEGDLMINAVAGSGKTTTLVQAAQLLPANAKALFCAFNKHIADELGERLKGTPMLAKTIHSLGNSCLYPVLGRTKIEGTKYNKIARAYVDSKGYELMRAGLEVNLSEAGEKLIKLANFARMTLTNPSDIDALADMAGRFGITAHTWVFEGVAPVLARGEALAKSEKLIDFGDMLWLPFLWKLEPPKVDWLFCDEAQDLNAAQLDLVLKCRGAAGRMVFVGDPKQSIYGFAGADPASYARIQERTNAAELPLSICYRCPSSHLELARQLVPQIEARPGAPVGEIVYELEDNLARIVRTGDLVLCRLTAPLVAWCIKLIAARVPAKVKGRDIGKDLAQLIDAVSKLKGFEFDRFGEYLAQYERINRARILQRDPDAESEVESLGDRCEAIGVCYSSFGASSVAGLKAEIESLFTDEVSPITFATVHRAKGLENDRVILLKPERLPLLRPAQKAWEVEQEYNLFYVALTRAKGALVVLGELTLARPAAPLTLADAERLAGELEAELEGLLLGEDAPDLEPEPAEIELELEPEALNALEAPIVAAVPVGVRMYMVNGNVMRRYCPACAQAREHYAPGSSRALPEFGELAEACEGCGAVAQLELIAMQRAEIERESEDQDLEQLIDVKAAALALGRPVRTVRYWAEHGLIAEAQRVGVTWVIPLRVLKSFSPPKRGNPNLAQQNRARAKV